MSSLHTERLPSPPIRKIHFAPFARLFGAAFERNAPAVRSVIHRVHHQRFFHLLPAVLQNLPPSCTLYRQSVNHDKTFGELGQPIHLLNFYEYNCTIREASSTGKTAG